MSAEPIPVTPVRLPVANPKHLSTGEDIEDIGSALDANSSCALMIWENVWAARFAGSLRDADGILIANGRIPAALVEEIMAESASA